MITRAFERCQPLLPQMEADWILQMRCEMHRMVYGNREPARSRQLVGHPQRHLEHKGPFKAHERAGGTPGTDSQLFLSLNQGRILSESTNFLGVRYQARVRSGLDTTQNHQLGISSTISSHLRLLTCMGPAECCCLSQSFAASR